MDDFLGIFSRSLSAIFPINFSLNVGLEVLCFSCSGQPCIYLFASFFSCRSIRLCLSSPAASGLGGCFSPFSGVCFPFQFYLVCFKNNGYWHKHQYEFQPNPAWSARFLRSFSPPFSPFHLTTPPHTTLSGLTVCQVTMSRVGGWS